MTRRWPGIIALCLCASACFGCRSAERRSDAGTWGSVETIFYRVSHSVKRAEELPAANSDVELISDGKIESSVELATYEPPTGPILPNLQFELSEVGAICEPFEASQTNDWRLSDYAETFDVYSEDPSRWTLMQECWREDIRTGWERTIEDHRRFYSREGLTMLAIGFGIGAAVANTDLDSEFQDWYQQDVRTQQSDDYADFAKRVGEGPLVVACALGSWAAGEMLFDYSSGDVLDEWGDRTIHTLTLGAPPMLLMQFATGASRPSENIGSKWRPFEDTNGVSGHTFMGALPFINAAKMSDSWALKAGFYACSVAPGWSRLNDNSHYASQVLLGWWMAYYTATVVDQTIHATNPQWSLVPVAIDDATGMGLDFRF